MSLTRKPANVHIHTRKCLVVDTRQTFNSLFERQRSKYGDVVLRCKARITLNNQQTHTHTPAYMYKPNERNIRRLYIFKVIVVCLLKIFNTYLNTCFLVIVQNVMCWFLCLSKGKLAFFL